MKKASRISHIQYPHFIPICEEMFEVCFDSEYKFLTNRRFQFDFALPCCKLAIEVEGIHGSGGHRSVTNKLNDIEKQQLATIEGWRMMSFPVQSITDLSFIEVLARYFAQNKCVHF